MIKQETAYNFLHRNPKKRLCLWSQKTISSHITITISLICQSDLFVYRSDFKTTTPVSFPLKSLIHTEINFFSQKLSTFTIAKFTNSARTDITSQTSVKQLRAKTMCSAFNPICRYDKSKFQLIGNVCCPNTMCSDELYVHKKTFQSLDRSDSQGPQGSSACYIRKILFEDRTNSLFLKFGPGVCVFEDTKKSFQDVVWMFIVQRAQTKSMLFCQPTKLSISLTVKSPKPALTCWIFISRTKNRHLCCLVVMVHIVLQGKRVVTIRKKIYLRFRSSFSASHNQTHPSLDQKKRKSFQLSDNCIDSPLVDGVNQKHNSTFFLYIVRLQ